MDSFKIGLLFSVGTGISTGLSVSPCSELCAIVKQTKSDILVTQSPKFILKVGYIRWPLLYIAGFLLDPVVD